MFLPYIFMVKLNIMTVTSFINVTERMGKQVNARVLKGGDA